MDKLLNVKGSLVEEYGAAVLEQGVDHFKAGKLSFEYNPEGAEPSPNVV